MSKKDIISILGLIVIFIPFLNLPKILNILFLIILGIVIIIIARIGSKKKNLIKKI